MLVPSGQALSLSPTGGEARIQIPSPSVLPTINATGVAVGTGDAVGAGGGVVVATGVGAGLVAVGAGSTVGGTLVAAGAVCPRLSQLETVRRKEIRKPTTASRTAK